MSHDFDNKDSAVGSRRRVNAVNRVRGDFNGALETEGLIRAEEIVVDGLRQRDDVQPLLPQQIGRLLAAVAAEHAEAVEPQLPISRLHQFHFVVAVFVRLCHLLERLPAGAEQGAAPRENAGKIILQEQAVVLIHEAAITVPKADNVHAVIQIVERFCDTAHRRIQRLAVAAAGQHTDADSPALLLCLCLLQLLFF